MSDIFVTFPQNDLIEGCANNVSFFLLQSVVLDCSTSDFLPAAQFSASS
jgi:hypothetical protein